MAALRLQFNHAGRNSHISGYMAKVMAFFVVSMCVLAPTIVFGANASDLVNVTHTGFGRNRATGIWSAVLTVKNTSGSPITGPVQVVLTKLSPNAAMVNKDGDVNGAPFIIVSRGELAPDGSASVPIQFTNATNGFITFTPVTYSGAIQ
jgi:hypothetical protein